jgi:predicted nucleic acid-binding protein
MSFLLDTNAVSEWVRPRPNPGLIGWMESTDENRGFISVISLAELRYGVKRLAAGSRRRRLEEWLGQELPLRFEGRISPVDTNVADVWGRTVTCSISAVNG